MDHKLCTNDLRDFNIWTDRAIKLQLHSIVLMMTEKLSLELYDSYPKDILVESLTKNTPEHVRRLHQR